MTSGGQNRLNLVGQRFGRLLVTEPAGVLHKPPYATLFRCRCDCGRETVVRGPGLKSGKTRSCGCLIKDLLVQRGEEQRIHGEAWPATVEYKAWGSMKRRCLNPRCKAFRNYGGRGISICERWLNSYPAFLADMGRRPSPRHSLDRIDNDKGYYKENCRWATSDQQNANRRNCK